MYKIRTSFKTLASKKSTRWRLKTPQNNKKPSSLFSKLAVWNFNCVFAYICGKHIIIFGYIFGVPLDSLNFIWVALTKLLQVVLGSIYFYACPEMLSYSCKAEFYMPKRINTKYIKKYHIVHNFQLNLVNVR